MSTKADLSQTVFIGQSPVPYSYVPGIYDQAVSSSNLSLHSYNYDLPLGSSFTFSFYITDEINFFVTYYNNNSGTITDGKIQIAAKLETSNNTLDLSFYTTYKALPVDEFTAITTIGEGITLPAIKDGNFHHIIARRDYFGADVRTIFYVDSVEVLSKTSPDDAVKGRIEIADNLSMRVEGELDHLKMFHSPISSLNFPQLQFETFGTAP